MEIPLYLPAVIMMIAAIGVFALAVQALKATLFSASRSTGAAIVFSTGVLLSYTVPVVFLIGLGMQIAHWA